MSDARPLDIGAACDLLERVWRCGLGTDCGHEWHALSYTKGEWEVLRSLAVSLAALNEPRHGMDPTGGDVDWIENEIGVPAIEWDMINPEKIVRAAWKRLEFLAMAAPDHEVKHL